jgi:hypothetical protein
VRRARHFQSSEAKDLDSGTASDREILRFAQDDGPATYDEAESRCGVPGEGQVCTLSSVVDVRST